MSEELEVDPVVVEDEELAEDAINGALIRWKKTMVLGENILEEKGNENFVSCIV